MKAADILQYYINRAHGDGYDNIELPIEDARDILNKLRLAESELEYIFNREGWVRVRDVLTELKKE